MTEERDERPVTLPYWVVVYLVENGFGEATIREAILETYGGREFEAMVEIERALTAARRPASGD